MKATDTTTTLQLECLSSLNLLANKLLQWSENLKKWTNLKIKAALSLSVDKSRKLHVTYVL